jgi:hypothetical protein
VSVVERLIQLCPGGDPQARVAVHVRGGTSTNFRPTVGSSTEVMTTLPST